MARTHGFAYGDILIGKTANDYLLDSAIDVDQIYGKLTASCMVIVTASSKSIMKTKVEAIEAEFRRPYRTLVITRGDSIRTFDHSLNQGFNQSPQIDRQHSDEDNELWKRFKVTVTLQLPADRPTDEHLAELHVATSESTTGLIALTFAGRYSAVSGGNDATAQFKAKIAALTTTIQDEISTDHPWEVVSLMGSRDKEDKNYQFERTYAQATDIETASGVDDSAILQSRTRISVTADYSAPMPERGFDRDKRITITYACKLDRSAVTTDAQIQEKWSSVILPSLIKRMKAFVAVHAGGEGDEFSVFTVDPEFNPRIPSISAEIVAVTRFARFLEGLISQRRVISPPWALVPIFSKNPGAAAVVATAMVVGHEMSADVIYQDDNIADAFATTEALLPNIPSKAVVGSRFFGPEISFSSRYNDLPASLTHDWQVTLNDYIETDYKEDLQGPYYVADETYGERSIIKVSIARSVEYFNAVEGIEPNSPRPTTHEEYDGGTPLDESLAPLPDNLA